MPLIKTNYQIRLVLFRNKVDCNFLLKVARNNPQWDFKRLGLLFQKCIELINPADFAAPLEEGMPTDLYFRYVDPPRVQTPEKVKCCLSRTVLAVIMRYPKLL